MTPSCQHLHRVKQNKVAPPRQGSKLYAAMPRSNSISWALLHGIHPGSVALILANVIKIKINDCIKMTISSRSSYFIQ